MKTVSSVSAAAALLLWCSVADAHHSFAMFDLGKDVTVRPDFLLHHEQFDVMAV